MSSHSPLDLLKRKQNAISYWLEDPWMNWPVKVMSAQRGASLGATLGRVVPVRGCVVSPKFVLGRPLPLVERILGLLPGELSQGAVLLRLNPCRSRTNSICQRATRMYLLRQVRGGVKMPFVYPNPGLEGVLVSQWRRGAQVKVNVLLPGTVIAIFDSNGDYVGTATHNHRGGIGHAALYVRQSSEGIEVVHQFRLYPYMKGALIGFDAYKSAGHSSGVSRKGQTPEDDANNYYVVEKR